MMHQPLLYSFRRCPYAMRARLALYFSALPYRKHEVSLKDKPAEMLDISPKGTVPVLQLADGGVIEESLDIALWALGQNDPQQLLQRTEARQEMLTLIERNDGEFKHWLDRYKYADRHLENTPEFYRSQGENFLRDLEQRLSATRFLMGDEPSFADIAIMPFIRQFAHVDKPWFEQTPHQHLQHWLAYWLESPAFTEIMIKAPKA